MIADNPIVSIGLPVYNGAAGLEAVLDSLIGQSCRDFEIIISDNASTDRTADICLAYAAQDARIRYIRQSSNIGAEANFKFVLDEARTPFFAWAASDDFRSNDYLAENIQFLREHPEFVASTSPNCFVGQESDEKRLITFAIDGEVEDRFDAFFDNCWDSHAIFYSVMRTDVVKQCDVVGQRFLGADWAIDLFLASRGRINRTQKGLVTIGRDGLSNSENRWSAFREARIGWVVPFHRFSRYAIRWSSDFPLPRRLGIVWRLLKLNAFAARKQLKFEAKLYFRGKKGRFARRFGWG